MRRLEWLVCYEDGEGRLLRCFACMTQYEAERDAAFLNWFGRGTYRVMRGA